MPGPCVRLPCRTRLLPRWRLFFQVKESAWRRCRKVNEHPLYLSALAVKTDHRDRRRAAEGVLRWVLEVSLHNGYVLARQNVGEAHPHPHLQITLQVPGQAFSPAPDVPLRKRQCSIVREGAHEEFVAPSSVVLLPSSAEVASAGLCELPRLIMLQPGGP